MNVSNNSDHPPDINIICSLWYGTIKHYSTVFPFWKCSIIKKLLMEHHYTKLLPALALFFVESYPNTVIRILHTTTVFRWHMKFEKFLNIQFSESFFNLCFSRESWSRSKLKECSTIEQEVTNVACLNKDFRHDVLKIRRDVQF